MIRFEEDGSVNGPPQDLPPHLHGTFAMPRCAFPSGVEENAYLPLLALLGSEMSIRNLAQVIAAFSGKAHELVLNDVYRAKSSDGPDPSAIERIRECLLPCGYEEWLQSD